MILHEVKLVGIKGRLIDISYLIYTMTLCGRQDV